MQLSKALILKQEVIGRTHRLLLLHTTRPTILLLLRIFFATGTCLPTRYLATGALPSNDIGNTHINTQTARRSHKPTFNF
jgi:hypothetical protein